jgi:hypothetical protein
MKTGRIKTLFRIDTNSIGLIESSDRFVFFQSPNRDLTMDFFKIGDLVIFEEKKNDGDIIAVNVQKKNSNSLITEESNTIQTSGI